MGLVGIGLRPIVGRARLVAAVGELLDFAPGRAEFLARLFQGGRQVVALGGDRPHAALDLRADSAEFLIVPRLPFLLQPVQTAGLVGLRGAACGALLVELLLERLEEGGLLLDALRSRVPLMLDVSPLGSGRLSFRVALLPMLFDLLQGVGQARFERGEDRVLLVQDFFALGVPVCLRFFKLADQFGPALFRLGGAGGGLVQPGLQRGDLFARGEMLGLGPVAVRAGLVELADGVLMPRGQLLAVRAQFGPALFRLGGLRGGLVQPGLQRGDLFARGMMLGLDPVAVRAGLVELADGILMPRGQLLAVRRSSSRSVASAVSCSAWSVAACSAASRTAAASASISARRVCVDCSSSRVSWKDAAS